MLRTPRDCNKLWSLPRALRRGSVPGAHARPEQPGTLSPASCRMLLKLRCGGRVRKLWRHRGDYLLRPTTSRTTLATMAATMTQAGMLTISLSLDSALTRRGGGVHLSPVAVVRHAAAHR